MAFVPLLVATLAAPLLAQFVDVRGYYLNVGVGAAEGAFNSSGASDFQRVRVMLKRGYGILRTDIAYEHSVAVTTTGDASGLTGIVGGVRGGGEWLPLQGTLDDGEHHAWRHRFDRLSVTLTPVDALEITAGRQTISWATTLLLTPADPFAPFDPSDPFREYRAGVDAFRLRGFPTSLSELEFVVRVADYSSGETVTALGRGRVIISGWELGVWAGTVQDDGAAGVAVTTTVAGAALRSEGVIRRADGATVVRFSVGLDRHFSAFGRDLYVVGEYQRDGFGAIGAAELPSVLLSDAFSRGELQVLGRDEVALQGAYQVHPLLGINTLLIWNTNDQSVLVTPALSYSAGDEVTARAGLFVGLGADATVLGLPGSEYGAVAPILYLSLSVFF